MFLKAITGWFASGRQKPSPKRPTARFRLEGLEAREVPALVGALPNFSQIAQAASQQAQMQMQALASQSSSLGRKMADYLQAQVNAGRRIGGGECAHLATEALRAAGGDFTRTEPAGTADYVWSSHRVARLTHGSQLAGKRFQVGDIIQYNNATFAAGGSGKLKHHTQVVAAVDAKGQITQVFEQNVNGNRTAQRRKAPDLAKLNGGSVSVYRPVARASQPGLVELTIVNNTKSSQTYTIQIGSKSVSRSLDRANTEGSYWTAFVNFSAGVKPYLKVGARSVAIQNGAAYELYSLSTGQVAIRQI